MHGQHEAQDEHEVAKRSALADYYLISLGAFALIFTALVVLALLNVVSAFRLVGWLFTAPARIFFGEAVIPAPQANAPQPPSRRNRERS